MSTQWVEETENVIKAMQEERKVIGAEYQRLKELGAAKFEQLGWDLLAKDEAMARWQTMLSDYKKRHGLEKPDPRIFLTPDSRMGGTSRSLLSQ